MPHEDGVLYAEVVEDANHVGGVRRQAVARLGFVGVATAAQVDADEPVSWPEVAGRRAEGPVLGRDAVQADEGVLALSSAADRDLHLAGDALASPDVRIHGPRLYARAFGEARGGNLPAWTTTRTCWRPSATRRSSGYGRSNATKA